MKFQTFYKKANEYLEMQLFFRVYNMILGSKIGNIKTPKEWLKVISLLHYNGYLYYWHEQGKLAAIVGAYRVKEVNDKINVIPEKEEGDILYVTLAVSLSEDKNILKKMFSKYSEKNPDVKEVVLFERGDDGKFKRFKLGGQDGKK